jgi:hypothetical protein
MRSFAAQLGAIAKDRGLDIEQLGKAVKLEVFRRVVINTRVDTGRLKGNWQITSDNPASDEVDKFDQTPGGEAAIDFFLNADQTIEGIGLTYLTNNLPYAEVWEERDGMVISAVSDLKRIVRDAAR